MRGKYAWPPNLAPKEHREAVYGQLSGFRDVREVVKEREEGLRHRTV